MIATVDLDGSGSIEFEEFLRMFRKKSVRSSEASKISDFFHELVQGKLTKEKQSPVSFTLFAQSMKRKALMDAVKSRDADKRKYGQQMIRSLKTITKTQRELDS